MRIAFVVPGFSVDAEDWSIPALQTLFCALAQEHEVCVFTLRYPAAGVYRWGGQGRVGGKEGGFVPLGDDGPPAPPLLTHYAVGGGQRFSWYSAVIWLKAVKAIAREHRRAPFDVIHAFWADEPGLVAVAAGRLLRRPVVVSLGGGELTYLPEIEYGTQASAPRRLIVQMASGSAAAVTAGSPYQLDLARWRGVPEGKLRLIPLGVDTNCFAPGPVPDWARPVIVQAASLTPIKNQALLLEVMRLVKEKMPTLALKVAGDGPLRESLMALAQRYDLSQNIAWQRQVRYPDMADFYRSAHLYLQSSRHESQGMAVLEAMACGLPVLGTPVGILPSVAALPAQAGASALADQVVQVLGDRDFYDQARRQARATVEQGFSLSVTMRNFLALYHEIMPGRKSWRIA